MPVENTQYHLEELKAALDPAHPAHILPPSLPASCTVLDIGCGAGQTLIAAYPDRISFGIDVDISALTLGASLTHRVRFTCGRGENLPYASGRFDAVVARVAMPYMNIRPVLEEIRRVLKTGGQVWMTLHPPALAWEHARNGSLKRRIYFGYVVVSSILFHVAQKQFSFRGTYETFQTEAGMRRAFTKCGFQNVSFQRSGKHFIATAIAG